MRRRQIYAAEMRAAMEAAPHMHPELDKPLAQMLAVGVSSIVAPPPGTCPHCLKHIGKGIAIHRRNCKG
jgi:hypothetical protein